MVERVIQTSFGAGEFSPALGARVDLEKYRSAAALLRNFWVDYKGGAISRPGTLYVGTCLEQFVQPILIPFIVSTVAAYVLEVGDLYMRFIANGAYVIDPGTGLPLEIASPYAITDLPILKWGQSVDVLTLTHPNYPPYNLTRNSPTSFSLAPISIGPTIAAPSGVVATPKNSSGTTFYVYGYVVTAVDGSGQESLPSIPNYQQCEILDQTKGIVINLLWPTVTGAVSYNIYKVGPTPSGIGVTSTPPGTVFGFIGSSATTTFTDNNIAQDFSNVPPTFQDPFSPGQIAQIGVTPGGTGYTSYIYSLIFTGDGSGASGYVVCDHTSSTAVGVVLTSPGIGYTHCTVTDAGPNTATYSCSVGPVTGTYPDTITYHQQRRVFGGTLNFPESLVMSQPGAYNNFNTRPVLQDDDAITISLASNQANAIESMISMNTGLIVLTSGGGFLVQGGSGSGALSPTDIGSLPQASSGANNLPPLRINYDVLYGQAKGFVVRDFAFNFYVQSYSGTDRSVLAAHLFTGYTAVGWAYAEEPYRQIHVVRNDGILLNFTYVPEQEIFAWSRSDTNGFFVSVATIPEGDVNAVYVIVRRLLNTVWTYVVERFQSRQFIGVQNAWCLDCALQLAETAPNAGIVLSGVVQGASISVNATANIFSPGDVGKILWAQWGDVLGQAQVTAYNSASAITATVLQPFATVPNSTTPVPYLTGQWTFDTPATVIGGLSYLAGQSVMALADGSVQGPFPITGAGVLTLPQPATKVVVGLPYTCQLQTLRLDTGQPTTQGKRKNIVAVTSFLNQTVTAGLMIGTDFDNLREFAVQGQVPFTPPVQTFTGEQREIVTAGWMVEGQVCFQQSNPLPVGVLAIVPEFMMGDDAR